MANSLINNQEQEWKEVSHARKKTKKEIPSEENKEKINPSIPKHQSQKAAIKNESVTSTSLTKPISHTSKATRTVLHDFDPENAPSVVYTSNDLSSSIKTARNIKLMPSGEVMTQAELDKACGLPKNTVRDYENGTATYNAEHINKIARVLGVNLPRPKKK